MALQLLPAPLARAPRRREGVDLDHASLESHVATLGRAGQLRNASLLPDTNREPRVVWVVGFARPWGGPGDVLLWLRRLAFCGLVR